MRNSISAAASGAGACSASEPSGSADQANAGTPLMKARSSSGGEVSERVSIFRITLAVEGCHITASRHDGPLDAIAESIRKYYGPQSPERTWYGANNHSSSDDTLG